MTVLSCLKKDFRNPLIPNFRNERTIDSTNDPILKADLNTYMQFKQICDAVVWSFVSKTSVCIFVGFEATESECLQRSAIAADQIHEQRGIYLHSVIVVRILFKKK
jgi:hypothetical protein